MSVALVLADGNVTTDYLAQLKTQDHNVLFSEVVRHARNLANVKAELKQLEADRAQLLQEDEVWRNTLVQVRQKVADREAEMAAWAQDLYDDVGKARADLANAVRDFDVERQELQQQISSMQAAVAASEAATVAHKASSDAKMLELKEELVVALNAQQAAQEENSNAVKARAEALQQAVQANAERSTANKQAVAAQIQRDQANKAKHDAEARIQEAVKQQDAAVKERDAALASREAAARDLDDLSEARHTAEAATKAAQEDLAAARITLAEHAEQISSLNVKLQRALEQQQAGDKERAALKAQASQAAVEQQQAASRAAETAAEEQERLQGELKKVQLALAAEKAVNEHAESLSAGLARQLQSQRSSLETAQQAEKEIESKLAQREKALSEQLQAATSAKASADAQTQAAQHDKSNLQKRVDSLEMELHQTKAALAGQGHKLQSADTAAQELNRLKTQAEAALEQTLLAKENAESESSGVAGELAELRKDLLAAKAREEKLEAKLNKLTAKSQRDQEAIELAQSRVHELTCHLTDAQLQYECAEKHRAQAQQQLDAQQEDFGKLGRHLQKAASPAVNARPSASMPQADPQLAEVSPRRISRRDKDLGLPSPIAEEPSPALAAAPAEEADTATPVVSKGQQPGPSTADGLTETPTEPQYRGSSDESDADMAEDEQDGSDESDISLQDTPKAEVKAPEQRTGLLASVMKPLRWLSPKPAAKPAAASEDPGSKAAARPSAASQASRRSRLAVVSQAPDIVITSPASQAQASVLVPAIQESLPAQPAAPEQQVKPLRRRSKQALESADAATATEGQAKGQTRAGKKRARNEESGEEGEAAAAAADRASPQTGRALLAEAAAMPLPPTEQKPAMKTMIPDSQEFQRVKQLYEESVHKATAQSSSPAQKRHHIEEAAQLASDIVVIKAKDTAHKVAAKQTAQAQDAADIAPSTVKRRSARSHRTATALQQAQQDAIQAATLAATPAAAAIVTVTGTDTVQTPHEVTTAKKKGGRLSKAEKAHREAQQAAQQAAAEDDAPSDDNALAATMADDPAAGLSRVDSGASASASKQGTKKGAGRTRKGAKIAAGDTVAVPAVPGAAVSGQNLDSHPDLASDGAYETSKKVNIGGSSVRGQKRSTTEHAAAAEAAPSSPAEKAEADGAAEQNGQGSGKVATAAQVPLPSADDDSAAPAIAQKAAPSGKRASSGTTGRSNATGVRTGRVTKAVSTASKGVSRRSSVKAPAKDTAPGRSLRSRRSTASQDPAVVRLSPADDTARSKPRHQTRSLKLSAVPEEEDAE